MEAAETPLNMELGETTGRKPKSRKEERGQSLRESKARGERTAAEVDQQKKIRVGGKNHLSQIWEKSLYVGNSSGLKYGMIRSIKKQQGGYLIPDDTIQSSRGNSTFPGQGQKDSGTVHEPRN